jgi:hypothetical protein
MVGTPSLTVVVPTIPGRESLLSRCLWSITTQAPDTVEIIVIGGPGQLGDKANQGAELASGSHMVLVDDDDYLAADFMAAVLPELSVDFVGYRILQLFDGRFGGTSTTDARNGQTFEPGIHGPTPKGVTAVDIWRACPMANHYRGDRWWCSQAALQVQSSVFIDRPLYVYDHFARSSAFIGTNEQRDVGAWPYEAERVRFV